MVALTLSFFLVSCGAKKDEALVTDFNAKKADADKIMTTMTDGAKTMAADHAAWNAKLDAAAKLPNADTAKIAGFRAQMKQHEDMGKGMQAMIDSLKAYENAKVDNNDQLKSAIAGLSANLTTCTSGCNSMMDAHKKLGADITAFLGGAAPAAAAEPAKAEMKTGEKKAAVKAAVVNPASSGHEVKAPTSGTTKKGSGSVIK